MENQINSLCKTKEDLINFGDESFKVYNLKNNHNDELKKNNEGKRKQRYFCVFAFYVILCFYFFFRIHAYFSLEMITLEKIGIFFYIFFYSMVFAAISLSLYTIPSVFDEIEKNREKEKNKEKSNKSNLFKDKDEYLDKLNVNLDYMKKTYLLLQKVYGEEKLVDEIFAIKGSDKDVGSYELLLKLINQAIILEKKKNDKKNISIKIDSVLKQSQIKI